MATGDNFFLPHLLRNGLDASIHHLAGAGEFSTGTLGIIAPAVTATLGAAAFAAWRVPMMSANRSEPETQFEESASDELVGLGVNG